MDRAPFVVGFVAALGSAVVRGVFRAFSSSALPYLIGTFGLAVVLHRPMSLRLAALEPAQALAHWPRYMQRWTTWNPVRTTALRP